MIKVVKGNLLDATETIIAHQVNCQKKMNSGVAKAIREKYPNVYEEYLNTKPQLGQSTFIFVYDDNGEKIITNMYAQNTYGYDGKQYTDYDAFRSCCKSIVEECKFEKEYCNNIYDVAMPYKIASDRGGADWDKIMDILLEELTDVDLTLYKL